jgi:hypothetical protein
MNDQERFNYLVEVLIDDRSPAMQAGRLDPAEQRMLLLAQRMCGSRGQEPSAEFLQTLRRRISTHRSSVTSLTPVDV